MRIIWSLGRDTIEIQAWFLTNTPPAVTVLALDDFAEFHVLVGDLLSPTLAGILRFNDQQSLPSSGSVTITSTLPPL